MIVLEQSVSYAHVDCVNNQTLELINFSHNLIFCLLSLMYLMNFPNTVSCMQIAHKLIKELRILVVDQPLSVYVFCPRIT